MTRFIYGAMGALVPVIVLFWSKQPLTGLSFSNAQYAISLILFALTSGLVAQILPDEVLKRLNPFYVENKTQWNALLCGMIMPFLISTVVAASSRIADPNLGLSTRGPDIGVTQQERIQGTLVDLISIF